MKVKFLGHAAFKITSEAGVSIITDPYERGEKINYGAINEPADIVTVSHEHADHSNAAGVPGKPRVIKGAASAEVNGIKIRGLASFHDEEKGKKRGNNVVFCFEIDGMRVCHVGDLGHQLTNAQIVEMGRVDILMVPVGGFYTIDSNAATRLCNAVAPKVIIPMHFKTPKCGLPIAPVDDFLKGKRNVTLIEGSETEFKRDKLPTTTQIIVLKPAL